MLRALKNRIQRLTSLSRTKGGAASGFAAKTARPNQEANQEVIAAVDAFLRRERSYDKRGEIFGALVSQFAEHNPVESQVAVMFNAVLEKIVAPMHHSLFWGDRMLSLDKAAGFLEDDVFRRSYEAIRGSHIYDAYASRHTIAWRLHTLVWAARSAIAQEGDLVECGVFKGDMSWVVTSVLGDEIAHRTFYLYDSFEGFSPKLSSAADFPNNPGFLKMANDIYSDPEIYQTVLKKFANMRHVKIIRGFVPDSFKIALPERIAFLHIDLNSPAAEIAALQHLFDRVVSGGYIVFDDYGWKQFQKLREAEDRFMADRGHYILELPTGQGLVIKQ